MRRSQGGGGEGGGMTTMTSYSYNNGGSSSTSGGGGGGGGGNTYRHYTNANGRSYSNSGNHSHNHRGRSTPVNPNVNTNMNTNMNMNMNANNNATASRSQQAPTMEPMMRCMTFVEDNSRIAFACYDEEKNEIVFEESRVPRGGVRVGGGGSNRNHHHGTHSTLNGGGNGSGGMEVFIEGFQNVTRPNLILVSSKIASNAPLLEMLTKNYAHGNDGSNSGNANGNGRATMHANTGNNGDGNGNGNGNGVHAQSQSQSQLQSSPTLPYQLLKSKSFDVQHCKNIILNKLRVMTLMKRQQQQQQQQQQHRQRNPQSYAYATDPEAAAAAAANSSVPLSSSSSSSSSSYHSLASILNFDSSVVLRAIGSLLTFLQNTLFKLEEGGTITVHSISHIQSSHYMKIDAATLQALHIFHTEHHPLSGSGGGGGGGGGRSRGSGRGGKRGSGGGGSHNNSKEGFSLFSLLDRTKSKVGRARLREWMLQPLLSIPEIVQRQDGIELFLQQQQQSMQSQPSSNVREIGRTLEHLLGKVGAVDRILWRMQRCHSVPMDFITLSRTLEAAVKIVTMIHDLRTALVNDFHLAEEALLNGHAGMGMGMGMSMGMGMEVMEGGNHNHEIIQQQQQQQQSQSHQSQQRIRGQISFLDRILHGCNIQVLQDLHQRIVSIVDEEATLEKKRGGGGEDQKTVVIHYGFHEELDNAKEAFDHLDETLSQVGSEVLQKHPELGSLKVVFLPQVGFLIAIDKRNHAHDVATNEFPSLPSDFAYVFLQDEEAFFKNPEMKRLDEEIGDLDAFIKDTEGMIVTELEEDILDCESDLRTTFDGLADLDCILAFAGCAMDLNFVRPEMIDGGDDGIWIENGRHPLQELIIEGEFIPNDTKMDNERRVHVVTGPNFSGKSCYTRQVGMLVYMSHIGCFIPCDNARISITDQILARISSVETCAVPQSSFQLDLTQMATILRRSTPRTLVLIDEFGKGTSPVSGIAVLTAALKKLITLRCKVICTTHFLEIFSLGLLCDGVDSVKVLQMAVHIPDSNGSMRYANDGDNGNDGNDNNDDDEDEDAVPLFKLEEGLAKSSAGLVCAKMAGVLDDVTARAREILGALKSNHQVKPIPANLNSNSVFQPSAKVALRFFLGVDSWKDEPEEVLDQLQERIVRM